MTPRLFFAPPDHFYGSFCTLLIVAAVNNGQGPLRIFQGDPTILLPCVIIPGNTRVLFQHERHPGACQKISFLVGGKNLYGILIGNLQIR
jgi:hypothetical protein